MTAPDPVMAAGTWRNNAELIRDAVVPLGYLRAEWRTLDPTYGLGRFWTLWRPDELVASDLAPDKSPAGEAVDFRHLPHPADSFDAVVLDPPYKLNGTSTGKGAATSDEDYGVERWAGVAERHQLIADGITEATRVLRPGGVLLVKCQDQVNGGKVRWQTRIFADHAEGLGHRLVDRFDLASYRAQPAGRAQQHARRNTSALLVFRLERPTPAAAQSAIAFPAPAPLADPEELAATLAHLAELNAITDELGQVLDRAAEVRRRIATRSELGQ